MLRVWKKLLRVVMNAIDKREYEAKVLWDSLRSVCVLIELCCVCAVAVMASLNFRTSAGGECLRVMRNMGSTIQFSCVFF